MIYDGIEVRNSYLEDNTSHVAPIRSLSPEKSHLAKETVARLDLI